MISRRRQSHGDDGATLILVLILITVISLVMTVIMSQDDTAQRTTDVLRDQAADVYSADGATQAVLNALKTSGINCTDPTNPTGVTLGSTSAPFYDPGSSQQGPINAYAQCAPDANHGAFQSPSTPPPTTTVSTVIPDPVTSTGSSLGAGDVTLPSYGLLTTGTSSSDYGVDFSNSASNKTICIENGSVASGKNIDLYGTQQRSGIKLAVRLTPNPQTGQPGSTSDCTTGSGVSVANGSRLLVTAAGQCITGPTGAFTPTACTASTPAPPTPAPPTLAMPPVSDNPTPVCLKVGQTTYVALAPGRYTNVTTLNSPCPNPGQSTFMWLSPGTYYFDFGTTKWAWPNTLLGGTPVDANGNVIAGLRANDPTTLNLLANVAMQNSQLTSRSCASPMNSNVSGVALVFGGASTVSANSSGSAGLCASSPTTSPPVAIYGLAASLTVPKTDGGTVTIPAETLCASTCGSSSLIGTDPSGQPTLYFNGYVYAPSVQIALSLKNSPGQVFNWGVVVRDFSLGVNGASPSAPFISLPKPNTGVGVTVTTSTPPPFPTTSITQPPPTNIQHYTIRYVNVWTCTVGSLQASGQQHCPATGTANVQVRVLFDPANPTSTLQVLNWNSVH